MMVSEVAARSVESLFQLFVRDDRPELKKAGNLFVYSNICTVISQIFLPEV
jgi:hypothetical protein